MDDSINKNLNKLYQRKCLEKDVKDHHKKTIVRVKKEIEELKENVEEKEQQNTKKFASLPKDNLFQFGEFKIYVTH